MQKINITEIYDKNINFLIGSGASYGLLPTLALNIKDEDGATQTIETLATLYEGRSDKSIYTLIFMHYYKQCIEPAIKFNIEDARKDATKKSVLVNYKKFIETLLVILSRRKNGEKSCNLFTTNYDSAFESVADILLQRGSSDFIINDGARGFKKRYLHAKNFNSVVSQTGVFDRYRTDIPQINLIHVHGSIYWYKDKDSIRVSFDGENSSHLISGNYFGGLSSFSDLIMDGDKCIGDIAVTPLKKEKIKGFWDRYEKLPIVNPTKWKFHETVFDEHYYQMLRLLSYELEKPHSIFITFGFSFADEHILNLVKRSLSNPTLQVFICCFNKRDHDSISNHFKAHKNVQYIVLDKELDFDAFNEEVFSLKSELSGTTTATAAAK